MNRIICTDFQGWDDKNLIGTSTVKHKNRGIVLKSLISAGQQSRAELARGTKLSAPTISRIIAELVSAGIVLEEGIVQTGDIGAPASIVSFNVYAGYVVGINIGESIIQIALSDLGGNVIDMETTPTKARVGGDRTVEQMVNGCRKLMKRNGVTNDMIWNICVGVPGTVTVDADDSIIVKSPDIKDWTHYPLKEELIKRIGVKSVYIENAQNLAVVCEHTIGCAENYTDVVFIHVKAGIGAGVLINGNLYRGVGGKAGEIGFTMPSVDCAKPDMDPNKARHGALEMQIGIRAILQKMEVSLDDIDNSEDLPDLEQLYQMAADGDEKLYKIIRSTWDLLGMTAVNICAVLNPQLIVLGGDILPLGEEVRDTITQYVQTYYIEPPAVKLSTQGNKTCMYGAVQMACNRAYQKLGVR